jgi:tetrahydromethanopterin S-methyltransferase subunit E
MDTIASLTRPGGSPTFCGTLRTLADIDVLMHELCEDIDATMGAACEIIEARMGADSTPYKLVKLAARMLTDMHERANLMVESAGAHTYHSLKD